MWEFVMSAVGITAKVSVPRQWHQSGPRGQALRPPWFRCKPVNTAWKGEGGQLLVTNWWAFCDCFWIEAKKDLNTIPLLPLALLQVGPVNSIAILYVILTNSRNTWQKWLQHCKQFKTKCIFISYSFFCQTLNAHILSNGDFMFYHLELPSLNSLYVKLKPSALPMQKGNYMSHKKGCYGWPTMK